jgi:membrane-associated HD superfamily phosphohydrolase
MEGIIELTFFIIAIVVLLKSRDWKVFFTNDKSNLLLIIPVFTVLLPTTIGYPFSESLFFFQPALAVAHLFLLVLFTIAVLKTLHSLFQKGAKALRKPRGIIVGGNHEGFTST